jgi:hypothetical protein
MEPTSSTCAVASLTCSQLALVATGTLIIGLAILYTMQKQTETSAEKKVRILGYAKKIRAEYNKFFSKEQEQQAVATDFSLLLITTSEKLKGKIEVSKAINGEYNNTIQLEIVKNLINTSRYFLIENTSNNTLQEAKTSDVLPDIEKDNLFILKITGQGKHNIAACKTKLALRDSITSESCKVEKVLHLLDARIAEKFIPTI